MANQSEKHTLFQTKMVKIYTLFQTKTTQKPYTYKRGAHTYIAHLREYPSRGISLFQPFS